MVSLESSKLFHELSPEDLRDLKSAAKEQKFAAQQIIFKEGEPGNGIYIIREGLVQIAATLGRSESCVLACLGPGELFGEMAVLDSDPRSATAKAEKPTTVFFISREDLFPIMGKSPAVASALVREISHRLRAFNQQYIREAIEAERLSLVGRFANSIIHDLKNPLQIINLSAELPTLPTATPEICELSKQRISKQVVRISNMVNELLEFSRGSRASFPMSQVDYGAFVNQIIEEIRPEVALRSAVIVCENLPPGIKVRTNGPRLARVFHNIINNAVEAMPSGGSINICFSGSSEEVITEIQDSGGGIAPGMINRLFEPFVTHGKENGTGLGLSIAKKIIEDHHGKIFARNAASGGAVFGFVLAVDHA